MKINFIIYYIILFIAFLLSVFRIKHDKKLLVFSIMLAITLFQELLGGYLEFKKTGNRIFFIYHIFAPVYYGLFAFYFSSTIPQGRIRSLLRWSIPFFTVLSICISFGQKSMDTFPGIQLNIMSMLLIAGSMAVLFQLDVRDQMPLFRRPIFWISISTMFFYAALFSLDGFVNYLMTHDPKLGNDLTIFLNINLNYLYYLLIIIGMLCSKPRMKYSPPSY
jgi:hypothetical protein